MRHLLVVPALLAATGCEPFLFSGDIPAPLPPITSDLVPPSVFFNSLTDGDVVGGVVAVEVAASDSEGAVASVELFVDGASVATRNTPPFTFSVDTNPSADGAHDLRAVAADAAANRAEATVTVIFQNRLPVLTLEAPAAARSDTDVPIEITSTEPLATLAVTIAGIAVTTTPDADNRVFTGTARVPPDSAPGVAIVAIGDDPEGGSAEVAVNLIVDDTPRPVAIAPAPSDDTHVAALFDVNVNLGTDVGGAALESCEVCARAGGCGAGDFVDVGLAGDDACGARTGVTCVANETITMVARVTDEAGNVALSPTITRTCSAPPARAPTVASIVPGLGGTAVVGWTFASPSPGDAALASTEIRVVTNGVSTVFPVAGVGVSTQLTGVPACDELEVTAVAIDIFGQRSPESAVRSATSHCGNDGTFALARTLELDADGSAGVTGASAASALVQAFVFDTGDIDRDGDLDVVIVGQTSTAPKILVLRQEAPAGGLPGFSVAAVLDAPNPQQPSIVLADVQYDGHLDIVATGGAEVRIFAGSASGNYTDVNVTTFDVGDVIGAPAVGAASRGDAIPDVVMRTFTGHIVVGAPGPATLEACAGASGQSARSSALFALEDLDGLPGAELIDFNADPPEHLRVRSRSAPGACPFSESNLYLTFISDVKAALALDADRNGRPDLAFVGGSTLRIDRDVASTPVQGTAVNLPNEFRAIAALDRDSDGDEDLVVLDNDLGQAVGGVARFVHVENGAPTLGATLSLPGDLRGLEVGDIDRNGTDDFLVLTGSQPVIHVVLGGGGKRSADGGFAFLDDIDVAGAVGAVPFDFDRDGDLDIVAAGTEGVFSIDVGETLTRTQLNAVPMNVGAFSVGTLDAIRGHGVFAGLAGVATADWVAMDELGVTSLVAGASQPLRAIVALDLQDDGDLDPVGATESGIDARINDGGVFSGGGASAVGGAAVRVADLDGDGIDEVIAASGGQLQIFIQGGGGLTQAQTLSTIRDATDIVAVDLNADGRLDLVSAQNTNLMIHTNDGPGGAFLAFTVSELVTGASLGPLATGDTDGDGDDDLLVGRFDGSGFGAIRILSNTGSPLVDVGTDLLLATGRRFAGIVVRDLDGDGPVDIIATQTDGKVAVLRGTGTPP